MILVYSMPETIPIPLYISISCNPYYNLLHEIAQLFLLLIDFFLHLFSVYTQVTGHTWRSEDNFVVLAVSFCHVDPKD